MEPQFVKLTDLRPFELAPGVTGQPLFGEGPMINLIEFEPGAAVPLHSHPHEQLGFCGPEGATVLDVFQPVRDDYRARYEP